MAKRNSIPAIDLKIAKQLAEYRHDPLKFVMYAYPWGEAGTPLDGVDGPQPWQIETLDTIGKRLRENPYQPIRIARSSGHGIGKSALVSWLTAWALGTCPNTRVMITANTQQQLMTKTWAEMSVWHNRSIIKHWFDFQTRSMSYCLAPGFQHTWKADAVTWSVSNTEAFAGLHNKGNRIVIIIDEASAVIDQIWEVIEGALTDVDTEIIWCVFGNPTRNTGRFRECFRRHRSLWDAKQIDSREVQITNKDLIQSWAETYGVDSDFFRIRVTGEFPNASSAQLIPTDVVHEAQKRQYEYNVRDNQPKILGIDLAMMGDDSSVVYLRQGLYSKRLLKFYGKSVENETDFTKILTNRLSDIIHREKPDKVFIDRGSFGRAIIDLLVERGHRCIEGVDFGGSPTDGDTYANKRIEMWDRMRLWLVEGGMLPRANAADNEGYDIENDLISPEYYYNSRGKMLLERKQDMKQRGLSSPDDGDALALTFAHKVIRNGTIMPVFRNIREQVPTAISGWSPMKDLGWSGMGWTKEEG